MSQIKISALPLINQATLDDVFIINDRNLTTSHITWANIVRTIERTNLNFTSSVAFDGNTRIGDFTYYSQEHLRKYPGILITEVQKANWDEAYSWGNHADAGYLDGTYVPDQSDYAETDTSVPTFIKNKPRLDIDSDGNLLNVKVNLDYVALLNSGIVTNDRGTDSTIPGATSTRAGLMTVGQYVKLDNVELGAQRNVQSNWDETDVNSDAYIINKPDLSTIGGNVLVEYTPDAGDGKITVSNNNGSDTAFVNVVSDTLAGLMTSEQKGQLETLSGLINGSGDIEINYNDLINLPNIIIDGDGNVSNIKVDLDYTAGATNGVVTNTKGDNATILGASAARAGLISATDYTRLQGMEDGAEANVDPTQSFAQNVGDGVLTLQPGGDTTNIPVATTALAGLYPPGHYNKVEGAEDGAQANVQSDWNQIDTNADDFIKNKPDVPAKLDDLTDVSLSTPQGGQVLMYSGAAWTNTGLGNTINYGGVHDFIDSAPPTVATDPTLYIHLGANADAGNVGGDAGYLNIIGDEIKDGDRVLYDPGNVSAPWVIIAGITDAPQTNLNYNQVSHVVANDNGTGFELPLADVVTDGLMSKFDKQDLDNLVTNLPNFTVDPSQTYDIPSRTLELSPGGDQTVLPLATLSTDGLMSAADVVKLDSIEAGAQVNVTPPIDEVLAAGNTAGPLQSLRFVIPSGENIPFTLHTDWPFVVDEDVSPFTSRDPHQLKSTSAQRAVSTTHIVSMNLDAPDENHVWDPDNDQIETWATSLNATGVVVEYDGENESANMNSFGFYASKGSTHLKESVTLTPNGLTSRADYAYGQTHNTSQITSALVFDPHPWNNHRTYKDTGITIYFSDEIDNIDTDPCTAIAVGLTPNLSSKTHYLPPSFHVDTNGSVTGKEFIGDGSKLTGIQSATDLSYVAATASGTVVSSTATGAGALIPVAGTEFDLNNDVNNLVKVAGLMSPGDKDKIDSIDINNDGSVTINGQVFYPGEHPTVTTPNWAASSGEDGYIENKPLIIDSSVTYGAYVTRDSRNPNATPGECPGWYCNRLDGGIIELTNTTINTETGLETNTTTLDIVIPIANDEDDGLMSAMDKKKYDGYNDKIKGKADDCPKEVDKYWAREYYTDNWGYDYYRWTRTIPYDFTTLPPL